MDRLRSILIEQPPLFSDEPTRYQRVCRCGYRTPANLTSRTYVERLFELHLDSHYGEEGW